jgi:transposase
MGKPYSLDFRKRAVAAVMTGGLSCNEAGKQFGVAVSTVIGWVRRQRETGSIAPGKMGGHRPKAISGEHRIWVLERTKAGDFTLRGLVAELADRGLKVDYRSVWEFVHAEKLSFKKAWWLANAIVPTWQGGGPSGSNIKVASSLSAWSSSTRPGPEPIWRLCGDGRRVARGFPPRFHTAAGPP